jgi:4-amino-4-deoxy-L-arabinose transferase-like glycosyltransferase
LNPLPPASKPVPRNWRAEDRWLAAAIAVLLLTFALRVWAVGTESAWIDEAYSIRLAGYGVAEILRGTAADQHPPLYYLMLHAWQWFGSGVVYARLLSCLLGVVHVALAVRLGRMLASPVPALGAGLFLALSPAQVWYSQEARMYMLLAVFALAATLLLWRSLTGRPQWVLYWLCAVLASYTHYFMFFVLRSHGVVVLVWSAWKHRWPLLRGWVLIMAALAAAFAPWLPIAANQTRFHTMSWIAPPSGVDVRDDFVLLFVGEGARAWPSLWRAVLAGALGLLLLGGTLASSASTHRPAQLARVTFLAAGFVVRFVTITAVSEFYPVFQFKQFIMLLGVLAVWLFAVLWRWPRVVGRLVLAAGLVTGGLLLVAQQRTLTKDDWRGASDFVDEEFAPGDLVIADAAASLLALNLYWPKPLPAMGYPADYDILTGGWQGERMTAGAAAGLLPIWAAGHTRVWLVEYAPDFWDPQEFIVGWLAAHGRLADERLFRGIRVRLFELAN